ncbi:DUF5389 domain-containing protein [Conservatibacter flavescens]|uniref:Uncharacterized protein n=1 Tax=Conservatibacter flavescens TaxID=28161 RepID=A0A2M8S4K9_9PAST|nr:DUF5389 domain-containing protein [Conservatibacter flavescens]PJG86077.1 hypothetical protein CVP05_02600 [Conservatibacter flavescens]
MKKHNLPTGFSPFTWGIALFCLPILLWPLSLLISPNISKNPTLTETEITWMSIFLWIYPFILGILARIAYRVHPRKPQFAKIGLIGFAIIFYATTLYVIIVGFNA